MFGYASLDSVELYLASQRYYAQVKEKERLENEKEIAPAVPVQQDFVTQWRAVTHYFLENKEHKVSVEHTSLPTHLAALLKILVDEEKCDSEGGTGPCMEYLLQHKILDTLFTLARADCPPGMKQTVLLFYTKLLSRITQPLLPHINVHKPVQRMVKLCGETLAAPSENEEIQFLCTISAKLCTQPYLVNFFIQMPKPALKTADKSIPQNQAPHLPLVDSLLNLMKSPDARVSVKACEGLMLCASLPENNSAKCLIHHHQFCQLISDKLTKLYKQMPKIIDPADIFSVEAKWGLDIRNMKDDQYNFPGKRSLVSFLSWLDYCDQLIAVSHPDVGKALAQAIAADLLAKELGAYVLQPGESPAITATAQLGRSLRLVSSPALLNEFVEFILGKQEEEEEPEVVNSSSKHRFRQKLLERCDSLSEELSLTTLKLFEVLITKPHPRILNNLLLRNLASRNYVIKTEAETPKNDVSNEQTDSVTVANVPNVSSNTESSNEAESSENSDSVAKSNHGSDLTDGGTPSADSVNSEDTLPSVDTTPPAETRHSSDAVSSAEHTPSADSPADRSSVSSDHVPSSPSSDSRDFQNELHLLNSMHQIAAAFTIDDATEADEINQSAPQDSSATSSDSSPIHIVHDKDSDSHHIVHSFLTLLHDDIKSSNRSGQLGYDIYLRDAHRQYQELSHRFSSFDWPTRVFDTGEENAGEFYEGSFLKMLLDRLSNMLNQSYEMNLQITSVLSRLSLMPHAHITEFMLNPLLTLHHRSLPALLTKLSEDVNTQIQNNPELVKKLSLTRQQLLGMSNSLRRIHRPGAPSGVDDEENRTFLCAVIVLEEFCKELAANAFVKLQSSVPSRHD